jgi:carboxypeptidase PM20D1
MSRRGLLRGFFLLLVVLAAVLAGNTLRLSSRQESVEPAPPGTWDSDSLAAKLAGAVRFRTITGADTTVFREFHDYLERLYPRVFAELPRLRAPEATRVPSGALLFEWPGTTPSLPPVLLLAHQDVVPVEPETEAIWEHPPFEGVIADGYVWGRGTMDDKGSVLAILEAVESLLAEGFRPQRGFFLAFGHDEEVGGTGARAMAEILAARGVRFAYALDEGLAVTHGFIPGVEAPVALVGIAEKGAASIELSVDGDGGHSSMPPVRTAPGLVAQAVARVETHRMPARLEGPTRALFESLAPEMRFPLRVVFANLWLFAPVVKRQLAADPATDAAVRTTTAVTILESGIEENVLPSRARAVVNFRIRPGERVPDVLAHVGKLVDTTRVTVRLLPGSRDPSPVSDPEAPSFRVVARAVRAVFPEALTAPALVLGGTDSRQFAGITDATYRFAPFRFRKGDGERLHGVDERLAVADFREMVRFYRRLIEGSAAAF